MSVETKVFEITTITCDFCGTSFNTDLQEYPCIDGEYAVFHLDFRCSH